MPQVSICTLKMVTIITTLNQNQEENIIMKIDHVQDAKDCTNQKEDTEDQLVQEFILIN